MSKNRFEFQFTEEGEVEFSNPVGEINIELVGIERSKGFRTVNVEEIKLALTSKGHSHLDHSTTPHSTITDVVNVYSESSIKRYFPVQKELNAIQWRVTTFDINANYITRTLQTWGTETMAGKPLQWRI